MPSLCPNSRSSSEPSPDQSQAEGPLGAALQIVEKKVRNLEKRKGKLDGYRNDYQRGKELNDDQKAAIAKYDEVLQTLEFARELANQFKTLAQDEDKIRKKQLKKENQERNKHEIQKIAYILDVQDLLKCFGNPKVKSDFAAGENGAAKLTSDQLHILEEFSSLITASRNEHKDDYDKALNSSAEHLMSLADGKTRKVVGKTSYKELRAILTTIKSCKYFEAQAEDNEIETEDEIPTTPEEDEVPVKEEPKEEPEVVAPVVQNGGSHAEKPVVEEPQQQAPQQPQPPQQQPQQQQAPPPQQQQQQQPRQMYVMNSAGHPVPITVAQNFPQGPVVTAPQQQQQQPQIPQQVPQPEVLTSGGNFNFLQDSQIDMESPHMDPAVVVVHHSPPQPVVTTHAVYGTQPQPTNIVTRTFSNAVFIPSTNLPPMQAAFQQPPFPGQVHTVQHVEQQQQQQQHQKPTKPAPGFMQQPQQQQQPPQQQPHQQQKQQPQPPKEDKPAEPEPQQAKPQGYAAIAAGVRSQPVQEVPPQTNGPSSAPKPPREEPTIGDWSEEMEQEQNNSREFGGRGRGRGRGFRGGRGYRGGNRGRGGDHRGDREGGYRGERGERGEGGYRGEHRGEGGYRGEHRGEGGYRGGRGRGRDRDTREFRGGRGRGRGGEGGRGRYRGGDKPQHVEQ